MAFDFNYFEKEIAALDERIDELKRRAAEDNNARAAREAERLEADRDRLLQEIVVRWGPWEKTLVARHPKRPYCLDYIRLIFDEFVELHGDRRFGDDKAIVSGVARCEDMRAVVLGQQKGRDLQERQLRNFGMSKPEGYRKAMRLMSMAEKFRLPIISLVDTPAADPGVESEERGISEAIAESMMVMFSLTVPVIVVIVGEGGSGGAIGIAAGNRICMLEHSVYSVIPPEGCAAILWRDPTKSAEAAESLKLTADSAKDLGIIDQIIPEPLGGAHRDYNFIASSVKRAILESYEQLRKMSPEEIRDHRYNRFRSLGRYLEASPAKS
ncbi:MAG: acetyl-CoA carboxylase carboxyltransferase subunit alpha [bacterium]